MKPGLYSPLVNSACVAIYAVVCLVMCRYILHHANAGFDTLMYTACVHALETDDAALVSKRTYGEAARVLPSEVYDQLTDTAHHYRREVRLTPAFLEKQLPFYRVKAGYVMLLSSMHKAGIPVFTAMYVINIASYLALAILLIVFMKGPAGLLRGSAVSTAIMLSPPATATALCLTPDMLTAVLLFSLVFCLSSGRMVPSWLTMIICLSLVTTRPENIIFVVLFAASAVFYDKGRVRFRIGLAASAGLAYLLIVWTLRPYPWAVLYSHSFAGFMPDPEARFRGLGIAGYLKGLKYLPHSVIHSGYFITVFLLLFNLMFQWRSRTASPMLTAALLASMAVRALLFPDISERYYAGYFFSAAFLVVMSAVAASPEEQPGHA